jgi:uncharacterized LabA/DUF88 family protein
VATNVYIDGFNLYYGCIRGTPYRWLDLEQFCERLLPRDHIHRVRYFTAIVSARPNDPQAPQRQETYLRALRMLPRVSIHLGSFLVSRIRMPLAYPVGGATTALVIKTEEKGSDVNLASYLLLDAFRGDCDTAVVVSNDSDLAEPVRMARHDLGLEVGVVNPHPPQRRSRELGRHAHFFKQVRATALAGSQLPTVMTDGTGPFRKPVTW